MTQLSNTIRRAALVALGVWMVPAVAAQFVDSWHWGVGGFVFAYAVFFATALAYGLIVRRVAAEPGAKPGAVAYKLGVGLALVVGFVLGWTNMVHTSESDNPVNLMYFGVLWVGAAGAWLARLKARGLARTLFAMAAVLAVMTLMDVSLSLNVPSAPERTIAVGHLAFAVLFAASGLLFRHASSAGLR